MSDKKILELLSNKDTENQGFRLLMTCYQEKLYSHIRRMVGSHEDTDDVLQNCFIKAFKGLANFQGNSSLYTWLYRIATNEAISYLASRKRRITSDIDGIQVTDSGFQSEEGESIIRKLNQAMETLPDKQKIVFNLRYYDEMSYQQMSEILETSVGALKASYHHALKKIESFITA